MREYHHRPEAKAKKKARAAAWYRANAVRIRERVKRNREENADYYRAYDRARGRRDAGPEKEKARAAVRNAVRSGHLARQPCEVCGDDDVHAHHDDYGKPLDVRWLCPRHHGEAHRRVA